MRSRGVQTGVCFLPSCGLSKPQEQVKVADPFPACLSEVEQSQAHPGPLGEAFAETLGEYSGRLEALSHQNKKGEGLDTCI